MRRLSNKQKIIILAIVAAIVVLVCFFAVLSVARKSLVRFVPKNIENVLPKITQQKEQKNIVKQEEVLEGEDYSKLASEGETKTKSSSASASDFFDLAVAYYNLGELDKAEAAYEQAKLREPANSKIYGNLGNLYRDKGNYFRAQQNYEYAIRIDSKNYKFYIGLAYLFKNFMNDSQGAVEVLEKGVEAVPESVELGKMLEQYRS